MLERRYYSRYCYYGNCNTGWSNWGRWVLLGVIIFVAILAILSVRFYSAKRVRHGASAVPGTAWMLPSYHQSQQHYNNPPNAAPVYNEGVGRHDAGYYDNNGNFVSKYDEEAFPQAHTRPDNNSNESYYRPPEGPPPNHNGSTYNTANTHNASGGSGVGNSTSGYVDAHDDFAPPEGPPPSAGANTDYYRPPEGPPPAAKK